MVKNYLVTAVRPIQAGSLMEKRTDLYLAYQDMWQMAVASYKKFITEPFEVVVWDEPVADVDTACMQNWYAMKELWHKQPCRILWVGADTLMIQPTTIFSDRFKEFRMFNYTEPRQHKNFARYFNDDVRYYPDTMSAEIWQLGEDYLKLRETAEDRHWGFDQMRHNAMFWSQDIEDWYHPEMAYQAMRMRDLNTNTVAWHDYFNGIPINQAHILHFHASRGSRQVINLMKILCDKLGIAV